MSLSDDAPGGGTGRRRSVLPPSDFDDDQLVDAAQAGDTAAFGELLHRHDDKMRGVVWRVLGSHSAMDDVLQDAYLNAWRAIGSYRRDAAFSSWLYSIVHRSALDSVRSQGRRTRLEAAQSPPAGLAVADHAGAIVESAAVRQALSELTPEQLAIVTLIDGEGHSYDAVAALLDISSGTVASRLHRARAALRDRLAAPGEYA